MNGGPLFLDAAPLLLPSTRSPLPVFLPQTFLVRRSNTRQCHVLCLRLPDNSSPAFVTTYSLRQEPTGKSGVDSSSVQICACGFRGLEQATPFPASVFPACKMGIVTDARVTSCFL